jgi:translocation and assembly module TamB
MKKALKVTAIIVLTVLILIGVLIWGIQTPAGQNFLTAQANTYLRKKLKTNLNVEKIRFDVPDWIVLEGVFFADQKGDTLLSGKMLRVDLDMYSLIKGNVGINKIELEGVNANIYRTLPDTVFNFQFIVDAFAGTEPAAPVDTTAMPMEMRLDQILLKRVHITYKDAVIGTDAEADIDSSNIQFDKFNPSLSQFHPTKIVLHNSGARLRMYEALVKDTTSTPSNPADSLDLKLGDIDITQFKWEFTDETSGLKNGVTVDHLQGKINKIFVGGQRVEIERVLLDNMNVYAEFAKKAISKTSPPDTKTDSTETPGWFAVIKDIKLVNNNLRYDDFNSKPIAKGLDYTHLDVKKLNIYLKDFLFSTDNITGKLKEGSFEEKSGFKLLALRTDFAYGAKQTYLRNLLVQTPKTIIRDELTLRYNSLEDLTKNLADVRIRLSLKDTKLAFSDILLLAPDLSTTPPFNKEPNGSVQGSGLVTGTVDNMLISKARFKMLDSTILSVDGHIRGLPDANKLAADITFNEISSTRSDLLKMLPDSTLPSSIELPEKIKISGKVNGSMQNLTLNTTITSSFGDGQFAGRLVNITDSIRANYDGTLSFSDFDLGKLMKQPPQEFGKLTLSTQVSGTGYTPSRMKANIDGTIQSADIKGYIYNNLTLKGNIDHGLANVSANMKDENIGIALNGQADLSKEFPAVKGELVIDHMDLTALQLYTDSLKVKGNVKIDMPSTNPENPLGTVAINDLVLTHHGLPVTISELTVQLSDTAGNKRAVITSPFLNAKMEGDFVYTEIADAVFTETSKHFAIPGLTYNPVTKPVNFTLDASIADHPVFKVFVPQLTTLKPVQLHAKLNNQADSSVVASLVIPLVEYDSIRTEKIAVNLSSVKEEANLTANVGSMQTGGFRVQNASLQTGIANNDVRFNFVVKDSVNTNRHGINGNLALVDNRYQLRLREGLMIDYQKWATDSEGYIQYAPDSVWVKNFAIRQDYQSLSINGSTDEPNSPLDIVADSISIGPFAALITRDSTMASGTLSGNIKLSNYMVSPVYTGRLDINNFAFMKIPIGNLAIRSTNETEDRIRVGVSLISDKNDMRLFGSYRLKEEQPLNFTLDMKKFGAETIEAFSFGQLKNAKGNLSGKMAITGSTDSPRLNGNMNFEDVAFNVTQLGARYSLINQKLQFADQRINFNNFAITDSLNQQLKINGNVNLATIPDVGYDLKIDTKNFTVLNATQKQNDLFFGKAVIDANLTVKGRGSNSIIDGNIKLDPESNITVVMSDDATEAGDASKGVIEFVDMSDSTEVAQVDSIEASKQIIVDFASQISLDIDVDDKSQFTVVIDELNGDNIKLRGNAKLNTGIAPNGQLYLIGAYDLTQGSYDLTLQILKRQFEIQKGSTLIWTGDPMKADLNITAAYEVMVDPGTVDSKYKGDRKIPIAVQIVITGNLSTPNITFNVVPGEEVSQTVKSDITAQTFWADMQNNPSEMNKQAFALLITNKFITDQSSSGFLSGVSAEAIARQSVSQLLSDQLNNLAGDLVKGVNLDLNLNSTTDQAAGARTDLNVGLSKAFLGDRLKISVGKNFELESKSQTPSSSEVFDNIALDYSLSKDGRYLFRGYRKNQYQSILEGFIIETGVSFIITADYDLFREIFQKNKNEN